MTSHTQRHIVLIGKTGVGKSSTANSILNINGFSTDFSTSSVTRQCRKASAEISGERWTVVDTPDFFYSTHEEDLGAEIKRSVELCSPGIQAFLLILPLTTFTEQEVDLERRFECSYGEEAFDHTLILFTHGDQLQNENLQTLISQNPKLQNLVNRCGGRVQVLNNKDPEDRQQQVSELLQKINRMLSANGNSCYTLEMLQEAERRAEEKKKVYNRCAIFKCKNFCVIALFSLAMGFTMSKGPAGTWTFVHGCGLGAAAAVVGVVTGKTLVLIWRSPLVTSCSSPPECSSQYTFMKRTLGLLLAGSAGSVMGYMCSADTPGTVLAGLAAATGALTATFKFP